MPSIDHMFTLTTQQVGELSSKLPRECQICADYHQRLCDQAAAGRVAFDMLQQLVKLKRTREGLDNAQKVLNEARLPPIMPQSQIDAGRRIYEMGKCSAWQMAKLIIGE